MGRYTGPKGRINRRLGTLVFEDSGAQQAFEKRPAPPGMAGRRRKVSNYGVALMEKQKIRFYYGLREKQLRRYYNKARQMKGNTGEQLLILCERRLDNAIRQAGLTATRPQARQGVVHRHFEVNGRTVDRPSYQVRPGDVIRVRNRKNLQNLYQGIVESTTQPTCDWITSDSENLQAQITAAPGYEDVSLPVDVGQVVAFLSR